MQKQTSCPVNVRLLQCVPAGFHVFNFALLKNGVYKLLINVEACTGMKLGLF
jgi:hypothetical protein